jgi:NhaP-type Na+/H+ and K+/H+ antiporter
VYNHNYQQEVEEESLLTQEELSISCAYNGFSMNLRFMNDNVFTQLRDNPKLILQKATYNSCHQTVILLLFQNMTKALSRLYQRCSIHMQRNVWTKFGIKAAANVEKVAATFSIQIEEELLTEIGNISGRARTYLELFKKYH